MSFKPILSKSIIPPMRAKPLVGWVVSSKLMHKTIKVKVPRVVLLPKYRKRVIQYTILLVHDPTSMCDNGDKIEVVKSRPYSKKKHHIVSQILVKDPPTAFLQANPEYDYTRRELKDLRQRTQEEEEAYKHGVYNKELEDDAAAAEAEFRTLRGEEAEPELGDKKDD